MGVVWLWARATTRRALGGLVLIAVVAGVTGPWMTVRAGQFAVIERGAAAPSPWVPAG
jgi:hypothetical protein